MKNWSLIFAAFAVVLIGCAGAKGGGGSTDGGSSGGSGGSTGGTSMSVNLPNVPALINVGFLTGQGRAPGDTFAIVSDFTLSDPIGRVSATGNPRRLLLKGYEFQILPLNVPVTSTSARQFNFIDLAIDRLEVDNGPGTTPTTLSPIDGIPYRVSARMTALAGRQTTIPIFLDDSVLYPTTDPNITAPATFDRAQFDVINLPPSDPRILGFISDYVAFDISDMNPEDRPALTDGTRASRVFFSGDGYGIAEAGNSGVFEALTLDEFTPFVGRFKSPAVIGSVRTPGTYSLVQPDPSDLSGAARITSLQGIWRNYTEVLRNVSNFEILSFPNSDDTGRQDVVAFVRSGSTITNFYFGEVNMDEGTIALWPIRNIVDASVGGQVDGTVSNLRDANGNPTTLPSSVRSGSYNLVGAPGGFRSSGTFLVFRR